MATSLNPPLSPLGIVSDDVQYGALLGDWLEHIGDMTWPASIPILVRMSKDPQIGASLSGYTRPVQRASWSLDATGCRPEVVALVADDMGLPIAGKDNPQAARVRGVSWRDHLNGSLEKLKFGHAGFEILAEMRDGKARLAGLPERMPSTIAEIHIDKNGAFAGISQNLIGQRGKAPQIPASRMVWHTHERRGASWQGTPLIRNSYSSWLLKVELQRILATSSRRFGMGVPNVEWAMGSNPTPGQLTEAHNLASAARVGDVAGASLPPGARLVLTGLSGGVPDTLGFIKWLDQQISRSMLAGWLDLGETSNGSRALGESFVDFFLMSLQTIAEDIAEVATRQIAARIVEWNWGPDEPVPAVRCADVGSRREVTAESLQLLLSSGALGADPGLEEYVRREWRLPEKKVVEEAPKPPGKPEPAEKPEAEAEKEPVEASAPQQLALLDVTASTRSPRDYVRDSDGKFAHTPGRASRSGSRPRSPRPGQRRAGRNAEDPTGEPDPRWHLPDPRLGHLAAAYDSGIAERVPLTGGEMAVTEQVTFRNGTHGVLKRPNEDAGTPPEQQADAEQLGALVAEALGVPAPRVLRVADDAVLMTLIPGRTVRPVDPVRGITGREDSDDGRLLGLLDLLTDNPDRSPQNLMVTPEGTLVSIDLAFAWDTRPELDENGEPIPMVGSPFAQHFLRPDPAHLWDTWADNDMAPEDIAVIRQRLGALRPHFDRLGRGEWLEESLARLDAIGRHATGTRRRLEG